jgi:HEPN domain-containing protein
MNATIREWVDKAEADLATARREVQASDFPNYDAVCFHAQQCVEKLMKALLIQHGITPPKTHQLLALHNLLKPVCGEWDPRIEDLRFLSRAAVDFRYPGESADQPEAQEAIDIAVKLRDVLVSLVSA